MLLTILAYALQTLQLIKVSLNFWEAIKFPII